MQAVIYLRIISYYYIYIYVILQDMDKQDNKELNNPVLKEQDINKLKPKSTKTQSTTNGHAKPNKDTQSNVNDYNQAKDNQAKEKPYFTTQRDRYFFNMIYDKLFELQATGKTQTNQSIADELGVHRHTVEKHRKSPELQDMLTHARKKVHEQISNLQLKAIRALSNAISPIDRDFISVDSAKFLLKNIIPDIKHINIHSNKTPEQLIQEIEGEQDKIPPDTKEDA